MLKIKSYQKEIVAFASAASLLLLVPACHDDLDTETFSTLEASEFPADEAELLSVVGATYGEMRGFLDPVLNLIEATTDEMVVPTRGPDWYDNASWQLLARHEWTPVSPGQINGSWEWGYRIIAKANSNLAAIEESPLQIEGKEIYVAELRVLRAFAHYWLMDLFGSVPIRTEDTPAGNTPQSPRAEVFAFVETEIKEALPDLRDEKGLTTYSRFTKGAANFLLTKLYLNAEVFTGTPRWADAIAAADAVINSPAAYGLNPDFLSNFAISNGRDPDTYAENILAVPYDKTLATGMNFQMRTLHYAQGGAYGLSTNPWNGFATRAEFYNTFSDNDQRKAMWLVGQQFDAAGRPIRFTDAVDNVNKPLIFTPEISSLEKAFGNEGVRSAKYEVQRNNARTDQDNDFAMFRFADVLLMKAEALLRTGDAAGALPLVNRVRERAGVPPFTTLTLDELLAERGRELAWEGWRRNDLIRFGRWESAWQFKTNAEPHRRLFPIPAQQLSNNPALRQNPGY